MADDKNNKDKFRTGFLGDMLKDLQDQLENEKKAKGKGRDGGSPKKSSKKPSDKKPSDKKPPENNPSGKIPSEKNPSDAPEAPGEFTALPLRHETGRAGVGSGKESQEGHVLKENGSGNGPQKQPVLKENGFGNGPQKQPVTNRAGFTNVPQRQSASEMTASASETTASASETASFRPGDMLLNTYRVESNAVMGGMGSVWRVHHTGWDVELAMKRPRPEAFLTETQKKRFTEECGYWINLGLHPNIVSCYYVREIEGVPTIFSEWMESGSLENHIKDGTLYDGTEEEVQERLLDIAIQFAYGLHYAHKNNLVHQDVKPDNLLIAKTKDWEAKVSDFGLASAMTMLSFADSGMAGPVYDPDATIVSAAGGITPSYCSPEQAEGRFLTRRTDIYSWAVSVMEMYLGRKPWAHPGSITGPLAGMACRDYFEMEKKASMPEELKDLLAQCMAMDPDDRPHDFGIVEAELKKIYKTVSGKEYPRPEPRAARDTAESLNNRALSFLDLGKLEEAETLWEQALERNEAQPEAVFNRALFRWRQGRIVREKAEHLLSSIRDETVKEKCIASLRNEAQGELTLDISGFPRIEGLSFSGFSADRRRGCGILNKKIEGKLRSQSVICTVPEGEVLFSAEDATPFYLLPDGKQVLQKKKDNDLLFEVDSGHVLWERERTGGEYKLSPDGKWAAENVRYLVKDKDSDNSDSNKLDCNKHDSNKRDSNKLDCNKHDPNKRDPNKRDSNNRDSNKRDSYKDKVNIISMDSGRICRELEGFWLIGFTRRGQLLLEINKISMYTPHNEVFLADFPTDTLPEDLLRISPVDFRVNMKVFWLPIDETRAVFMGFSEIYIIDVLNGSVLRTFKSKDQSNPCFAALIDGTKYLLGIFANWKGASAYIWDTATGQLLQTGEIEDEEFKEAYKRDGIVEWLRQSHEPASYCPGTPAQYRLSLAAGTSARLDTEIRFLRLLEDAEAAYERGALREAFSLAEEAAAQPGFEAAPEPLAARARFGKGLEKRGISRIQILRDTVQKGTRRNSPDNKTLQKFSSAMKALEKKLLALAGNDIFSEYSVKLTPAEYSLDGRFLLVDTETIRDRDSPAQAEIERTIRYGAAVLDTASAGTAWLRDCFYIRDEYDNSALNPHAVLDHSGARILICGCGLFLQEIKNSASDPLPKLADGEMEYADFLDDDRYVLCLDMEERVKIIDTKTRRVLIEHAFPKGEYGSLIHVDDDFFGIYHGGEYLLCRIVWEYALPDGN